MSNTYIICGGGGIRTHVQTTFINTIYTAYWGQARLNVSTTLFNLTEKSLNV